MWLNWLAELWSLYYSPLLESYREPFGYKTSGRPAFGLPCFLNFSSTTWEQQVAYALAHLISRKSKQVHGIHSKTTKCQTLLAMKDQTMANPLQCAIPQITASFWLQWLRTCRWHQVWIWFVLGFESRDPTDMSLPTVERQTVWSKDKDALPIDLKRRGMEWYNIPKQIPRRTEQAHKNH